MDVLDRVLAAAEHDHRTLGVVLTGSRARGLETARSDYDVTRVVAEQDQPWRHDIRTAGLDEVTCTVEALADTSVRWPRYGFRGAKVLLDRLGGGVADLVEKQATPTEAEATESARANLDAYLNQLYRAAKNHRDGYAEAAQLDEMESVAWLLETVFALHGRLRPYNKYLRWELDTYPLPDGWDTAQLMTGSLSLFPAVESRARRQGHADVLDGWGTDVDLIRAHAAKRAVR